MEQLYRWIRCKEKTPNPDDCFRELWQNPYDENHKSWMYFNGKIDEFDQIYDEDFIIEPINQDTVEWLSPIEESEHEEARNIIAENLYSISGAFGNRLLTPDKCDDFAETFIKELSSKYHLIKK